MDNSQDNTASISMMLAAQTETIACGLFDSTGGQNIYIGDSIYTSYFAIHNMSSSQTYGLVAPATIGTQPATTAHFYLAFSVAVLLSDGTYPTSGDPDWLVSAHTTTNSSGQTMVSGLYLTYIGANPYQLAPESNHFIPIIYKSLDNYDDETECKITISLINLSTLWSPAPPPQAAIVMNESLGAFVYELFSEIVGVGAVYTDGQTANTIVLRLTNPTTSAILLAADSTIFKFSIDTAANNTDASATAALCTPTQAQQISISVPSGFATPNAASNENDLRTVWEIKTSPGSSHLSIPAGGALDFTIAGIKTDFPVGRTALYVQCVNVPSLHGQIRLCMVDKTALYTPQWVSGTASYQVGTTLNSAALLYAPTTLTNGGAGLKLYGATLADPSASIGLIRIDGTGGYHGIMMENIGGSTYGLNISAVSAAAALYVSQTGSGAAMTIMGGAGITANNNSPTLHLTQNAGGNSLKLTGGAGAVIETVNSDSSSLTITANTTASALQITQNGNGNGLTVTQNTGAFAATLNNRGLSIQNVTSNYNGLLMSVNTTVNAIDVTQAGTGSALKLTQSSTGRTLQATGGAGVSIDGISGSNVALTLSANSTGAALSVNQSGTGAGINIIQNNGPSLTIQQGGSSAGLTINQTGTGPALLASATSGQQAAKFTGDVEIDGNLVVKGGRITIDTQNDSGNYVILQSMSKGDGATLEVMTSGFGPANIYGWDFYGHDANFDDDITLSTSSKIYFTSSGVSQNGNIHFNTTYGMSVTQNIQDSGKIKLDSSQS